MKSLIIAIVMIMIIIIGVPAFGCIGARAAGMGYAGVACADDATVTYWNPSLLPEINNGVSFENDFIEKHLSIAYNSTGFYFLEYPDGRTTIDISHGFKITNNFFIGIGTNQCGEFQYSITLKNNVLTFALLVQDNNYRPSFTISLNNFSFCYECYDILNLSFLKEDRLGAELKLNFLSVRAGMSREREQKSSFSPFADNSSKPIEPHYYYGLGINLKKINLDLAVDQFNDLFLAISLLY